MELRCNRYRRTAAFDFLVEIFREDFRDLLTQATDPTSASLPNQDDIDSSQLASYHRLDIPLRFSVEYLMTVGGGWREGGSTKLHDRQTQVLDIERLKKKRYIAKSFQAH